MKIRIPRERVESRRAARDHDRVRLEKLYRQGARIRTFLLPDADLRQMWQDRPRLRMGVILAAAITAAAMIFLSARYGFPVGVGLPSLVFAALCVAFQSGVSLSTSSKATLVVRGDGVVVRERFFPHSMLGDVFHYVRQTRSGWLTDANGVARDENEWLLLLGFAEGDALRLGARWVDAGQEDEWGADIALEIEAARAAWAEGHAGLGVVESAVTRGHRSGREWLDALRQVGARSGPAYRGVPVDLDRLSQLLDDGDARPSSRAAAAIVLAAAGDTTSPVRLRIAAGTLPDPRLRVALETVAASRDDEAVAEALGALEESDGDMRAR